VIRRQRHRWAFGETVGHTKDPDPLEGLANLFDIGIVFITGLVLALFSAHGIHEIFDPKSEITITKKTADGGMEIITKEGNKLSAIKVTKTKASGKGTRLGIAYQLENGTMVYVPE